MPMADYFSAAYPEPWQVLGVKLLPFSFGHYIKLKRLGCAFISEQTESATLGDLLIGILVCSMRSHPDPEQDPFWQWLHRDKPDGFWAGLRWKFRMHKLSPAESDMIRWGNRIGVFDIKAKAELFAKYIAEQSAVPPYVEEPSSASPRISGAHWAQSIMASLVSKCGYSQLEAYNVPMPKAMSDFFKHAESEGSIRLLDPKTVEALG